MNFNCPVAETSESIEPNDNNLELNAIAFYTFSKIDSNLNFNTEYARSFGDRELLAFSSEANGETEKKHHFLCCGRFNSVAVAFRNTKMRREDETKGPNRQRSKAFLVLKALSKQNIKASLASLPFDSSRALTEWSAIFAFGVFQCFSQKLLHQGQSGPRRPF